MDEKLIQNLLDAIDAIVKVPILDWKSKMELILEASETHGADLGEFLSWFDGVEIE